MLFLVVDGSLLERDLGHRAAARQLDVAAMRGWRAANRGQRFTLGVAGTALFMVPMPDAAVPVPVRGAARRWRRICSKGATDMKAVAGLAAAALLAGCAAGEATTVRPARPALVPIPGGTAGLDRVMGAHAAALTALFGPPVSDVREGTARKLQFGNATCVLDAYLYPKGAAEPTVSYVDARQTDGSPVDRASCVGALQAGRR